MWQERTFISRDSLKVHRLAADERPGVERIAIFVISVFTLGPSPARGQELPAPILERAKQATVMVGTFASRSQKADTPLGSGTGYFINSTGLLITNNHVVDPAHGKSLRERQEFQYHTNVLSYKVLSDGGTDRERIWDCELLHQSLTADQALLQALDEKGEKLRTPDHLRLLPPELLKARTKVCALGFPGGNAQRVSRDSNAQVTVSCGEVTEVPKAPSGRVRRIMTNVIARPGNSGGPMVDFDGYVVGTVTLLGQSEEEANTCALVPTALTRAFLQDANLRERIPRGSDFQPLFAAVASSDGRLNIHEYKRFKEHDVLYFSNNEQVYGTIDGRVVTWNTPLGRVEIPSDVVAYSVVGDQGVSLVLEGGNHFFSTDPGNKLKFSASGGSVLEKDFNDVAVIGFRTREIAASAPDGELIAMESSAGHLVLANVKGSGRFESRAGVNDIPLEQIRRIESDAAADQQVVLLTDGRRLNGRFKEGQFEATLASTGTPVRFELGQVRWARIDRIAEGTLSAGMTLRQAVAGGDPELIAVAALLEEGKVEEARSKLEPWMQKERLVRASNTTKAQVCVLDGMATLRAGDADGALAQLRKCIARKDENISAYARGCVEVLKRYKKEYEGKPLSDRNAFREAGLALGRELIRKAEDLLKDRAVLDGKRTEYHQYINRIASHEKAMQAAAVFTGPEADDVLIDLWKFAMELCEREYVRLKEEFDRIHGGRSQVLIHEFHKLEDIRKKAGLVADVWQAHHAELIQYGFYYSKDSRLEEFPK